jgi:hypothetical protein
VPGDITHVIINSGTPNPCAINGAGATAASVQLKGGATISIGAGFQLQIKAACNPLPAGSQSQLSPIYQKSTLTNERSPGDLKR